MYIIFDTETTGKPADYKLTIEEILRRAAGDRGKMESMLGNWPRITQLAWMVVDKGMNPVSQMSRLIKPDGWVVPTEQFFVDNNMSTERCEKEGVPLAEAMTLFIDSAANCEVMVAHNMAFDYNVMAAEMLRYGLRAKKRLEKYCTMEKGAALTKLPGFKGQYKWPSLHELHMHLFKKGFDGAHDAMHDVMACGFCFFEMKRLDIK